MPVIDAPRSVVFVHGVQWVRDTELKGYSRPLQDLIQNQAPSVRFRFHEVLWSDVVEEDEQKLLAGIGLLEDLLGGKPQQAVFDIFALIGQRTDFSLTSPAETFGTSLPKLIEQKKDSSFITKALSAVLDLAFYFSDHYGLLVRQKVRETLDLLTDEPPPILFGHSLGSVILLDILREDIRDKRLHTGGFVSAGSPIGLFQPKRDIPASAGLEWVNFYDADDLVGFWNPLRRQGYKTVMDQRVDTHEFPFYSHVKYWTNAFVAGELADMSLTI